MQGSKGVREVQGTESSWASTPSSDVVIVASRLAIYTAAQTPALFERRRNALALARCVVQGAVGARCSITCSGWSFFMSRT